MKRIIPNLFLFLSLSSTVQAQQHWVEAGPDQTICRLGQIITLLGTHDTLPSSFNTRWEPAALLVPPSNNPNATTVTVAPTSTTTYYFSTYFANLNQPNLVINGDFSNGNTNFVSGYKYENPTRNALVIEGKYSIVHKAYDVHDGFSSAFDHTSGTGSGWYMAVNGSMGFNTIVWQQQITDIRPNTQYVFCAWVMTLNGMGATVPPDKQRANLQFSINNNLIGDMFMSPQVDGVWQRFYTTWLSGTSSTATITIVNQNTTAMGNDFGLDDIYFSAIQIITDSVTVRTNIESYRIDTTICRGDSVFFGNKWRKEFGVYYDTLISTKGCDSIVIFSILEPKAVDLGKDVKLCKNNCCDPIFFSAPSGFASYLWEDGSKSFIRMLKTGDYSLTVSDTYGCTSSDSISILLLSFPWVEVSNLTEDFCRNFSAELQVESNATDFQWNTGEITDMITVHESGRYEVIAFSDICYTKASILVPYCDFQIYLPNAFTPFNKDGINDYFQLPNPYMVEKLTINIYNRFGELVFYSENTDFKWDGTHKGKACANETFSYIIHLKAHTGKPYVFKGVVTVL